MTDSLVDLSEDDLDELNNRAEIIKARELYTRRIQALTTLSVANDMDA